MKLNKPVIFKYITLIVAITFVITALGYLTLSYSQEPYVLDDKARAKVGGAFVKLRQGYVRYDIAGPDTGKVVVLIHGAGSGYYAWDFNFETLASKGFRVLRYDLYGRGYSDRPALRYDLGLFREQLSELLNVLRLDTQSLSIVGVSMGATIALDYTQRHKEQVRHLVLVDAASLGMGKAPWYIQKPMVSDLLFTFYWRPRAVEKQMHEFYAPSRVPEYRAKTEDQMKYRGFKEAIKSTWIHTLGLDMSSSMVEIGRSQVATHLIWGKNDPLIPYQASKEYLKHMPKSTLDVVDEAGHLSNYERPSDVNALLIGYLDK